MYCPDVVALKQFYASPLGQKASMLIWRRLRAFWPAAPGETVLGIGYPTPYLAPDCTGRDLTLAAMPGAQGALYWPIGQKNRVVLLDEAQLPYADGIFNRVLIIHALEHSDSLHMMMKEVWRVLVPGGRMLAVVPNRMGLWSHTPNTPFGYGRPFSSVQMRDLVGNSGLTLTRVDCALFAPPSPLQWLLKLAPFMEFIGRLMFLKLGGVLLVEAEKQIYAALKEPVRARGTTVMTPVPAIQSAFSP